MSILNFRIKIFPLNAAENPYADDARLFDFSADVLNMPKELDMRAVSKHLRTSSHLIGYAPEDKMHDTETMMRETSDTLNFTIANEFLDVEELEDSPLSVNIKSLKPVEPNEPKE